VQARIPVRLPDGYDQRVPVLTEKLAAADLHRLQQGLKWIVYSLLLVNFGFYIFEDWNRAVHTLGADATIVDWAGEFATSIDEAGWFILLFMFELETYVFEDETLKGQAAHVLHGVRLLCFAMLAHTVFAYGTTVVDYAPTLPADGVTDLCDIAGQDISFVYNLEYSEIGSGNCNDLPEASRYYWLGDPSVITTGEGLSLERQLAWVDVVEAVAWLAIVLAIEVVVRLQGRGQTGGPVIRIANFVKMALYGLLFAFAAWWAWLSHWLYAWDEFVWIAGFAAIEMNVSEWRKELIPRTEGAAAS
jgi:hypothetical protein